MIISAPHFICAKVVVITWASPKSVIEKVDSIPRRVIAQQGRNEGQRSRDTIHLRNKKSDSNAHCLGQLANTTVGKKSGQSNAAARKGNLKVTPAWLSPSVPDADSLLTQGHSIPCSAAYGLEFQQQFPKWYFCWVQLQPLPRIFTHQILHFHSTWVLFTHCQPFPISTWHLEPNNLRKQKEKLRKQYHSPFQQKE